MQHYLIENVYLKQIQSSSIPLYKLSFKVKAIINIFVQLETSDDFTVLILEFRKINFDTRCDARNILKWNLLNAKENSLCANFISRL